MDERKIARRDFIRASTGLAAMAGGLGARSGRGAAPNEKVGLGFIGCGGRAKQLMNEFKKFEDVEILAISDVARYRMTEAAKLLAAEPNAHRPQQMDDYRKMLELKKIAAVVIATTQHWHGLPFIHACQAGKHIFVEKPLSHTVVEGRAMVEWAKKTGVIAMMGTQQRAGEHYKKAVAKIRAGELGKIALVECWNYHNTGKRTGQGKDGPPLPGLDWDRWLGPAPYVPWNPSRMDNSWWFAYSGGMMTNWAIHHIDIILWAMDVKSPARVSHAGGKFVVDDLADAPDTIEASWDFSNFTMQYTYRGFNNFHTVFPRPQHHGIAFHGNKATMVLDRFGYDIWPDNAPGKSIENHGETPQDGPWQRTFIDCVKSGKPSPVDIEDSHRATVCCHLANIAYKVKRTIQWDGAKEMILSDPEANSLLSLPRRSGYELPKP
jgi:predicted dehydrogenase